MTTVQELIDALQKIENKDLCIIVDESYEQIEELYPHITTRYFGLVEENGLYVCKERECVVL